MSSLAVGIPSGGNCGFAIDLRSEVNVRVAKRSALKFAASVAHSERSDFRLLIQHVLAYWGDLTKTRPSFSVDVRNVSPLHIGLASSAAIQVAVLYALNWLYGNLLCDACLREHAGRSYREVVDGKLHQGFTTGLSSFLNLYGGFAVIDTKGTPVFHTRLPDWDYVYVVLPQRRCGITAAVEYRRTFREGRHLDVDDGAAKKALLWSRLVPAIERKNLSALGAAVKRMQQLGSKRAECSYWGSGGYAIQDLVRRRGVECCFLSATGPGVVCLMSRAHRKIAAPSFWGLRVITAGRIDNKGLQITDD